MPAPVVILGAGPHGRNVRDLCAILARDVVGFLDDTMRPGPHVNGVPVLGGFAAWSEVLAGAPAGTEVVVALGDTAPRAAWCRSISDAGAPLATLIHPQTAISPSATLGAGLYVGAFARLLANANLGRWALIEGLATVGSDVVLGDAVTVGIGAQVTAGAAIGARAFIGAGAVVVGPARVGPGTLVAAGAVVATDLPDEVVARGVPARVTQSLRG